MHLLITRLRQNNGFSLLELLIVMLVLGILLTIGMYSYTSTMEEAENIQAKHDQRAADTKVLSDSEVTPKSPDFESASPSAQAVIVEEQLSLIHAELKKSVGEGTTWFGNKSAFAEKLKWAGSEKYTTFTNESKDLAQDELYFNWQEVRYMICSQTRDEVICLVADKGQSESKIWQADSLAAATNRFEEL